MIVVGIVAALAAISIPLFNGYLARSKSAEAKTNLGSLRVAEDSYFTENDVHLAANPEPPLIPGSTPDPFDAAGSDFDDLGWTPEGRVYFSYAVAVSADGSGYTADAGADLDLDGIVQLWGYTKPDGNGAMLAGNIGCDTSFLQPQQVGRCGTDQTIY